MAGPPSPSEPSGAPGASSPSGPTGGHGRSAVHLRPPTVADGGALWSLAKRAGSLDVNSSYAYLLWCHDFATTSVVARDRVDPLGSSRSGDGEAPGSDADESPHSEGPLVGFVTGYRRPGAPSTLLVWQVAVASEARGRGVAGHMLDALVTRLVPEGVDAVETTVTPDNAPSRAMFASFAARHGAATDERELFAAADFPDGHEPEMLLRIAPFGPVPPPA